MPHPNGNKLPLNGSRKPLSREKRVSRAMKRHERMGFLKPLNLAPIIRHARAVHAQKEPKPILHYSYEQWRRWAKRNLHTNAPTSVKGFYGWLLERGMIEYSSQLVYAEMTRIQNDFEGRSEAFIKKKAIENLIYFGFPL